MDTTGAAPTSFTSPLHLLWSRMSRPFNLVHTLPAMCGIPASHVADLVTLHQALTTEAERLIQVAPELIRSMPSTTKVSPQRTVGAVTGPVLWAETLSARANGGADDVFVCGAPSRDYNTPENQVLAAALGVIARSGRRLDTPAAQRSLTSAQRATIASRSAAASRHLATPLLAPLKGSRPTPRTVAIARQSRNAPHFAAALAMWERRHDPIHPDELLSVTDPTTRGQQRALVLVMLALQRRGVAVPQLRVEGGELRAGDLLRYRNWRRHRRSGDHGVLVRGLLVDGAHDARPATRARALASLERRANGRLFCLVTNEQEADFAVELALAGRQPDPARV